MQFEKDIEAYLVKRVRNLGGLCWKFVSPGTAGVPDRIIIAPFGIVVFVELKRPGGVLSEIQKKRIQELSDLGANIAVITSKDGVDKIEGWIATQMAKKAGW